MYSNNSSDVEVCLEQRQNRVSSSASSAHFQRFRFPSSLKHIALQKGCCFILSNILLLLLMATRLQVPFRALSADNFLSRGSAGQVFAISPNVVFKCPTVFENPITEQAQETEESIAKIANEQAVYKTLMAHPHPNIVHGILCISEGIFLQRLGPTLEYHITQCSPSPESQNRWIRQLASALAWLERLGYVHGDLRPANIFLDVVEQNIRLGDFDATVKIGEQLKVASEPFCKLNEAYEFSSAAGPDTEQFALASCIYNIRFGHKPHHDLDAPARVRKLMMNEFPSTSADGLLGALTTNCWYGVFDSIRTVEQEILLALRRFSGSGEYLEKDTTHQINDTLSHVLLSECELFLANEGFTTNKER